MKLLTSLLLLLILSRLLGQGFKQLFQLPPIVGEILAGVILGPSVIGWIAPTPELNGIAELAVFLVIFAAGLEMKVNEVYTAMRGPGLPIALMGFLTPLAAGLAIGYYFRLDLFHAASFGLCLAVTALPVVLKFLETLDLITTPLGQSIVGATILIDILTLLVLGVLPESSAVSPTFNQVTKSLMKSGSMMIGFLAAILILDRMASRHLKRNRFHKWLLDYRNRFGAETLFGVSVLFVMLFSSITEMMGFHFIIGAFFGGLLLSQSFIGREIYRDLKRSLNSISNGFLAPIFFAFIGLQFSNKAFGQPFVLLAVIVLGLGAKTVGGWLGAKFAGLALPECLAVSFIMNARGVMDLVVAEIAFKRGFIREELFSSFIALSIVATFLSPLFLRAFNLSRRGLEENNKIKSQ